MDGNSRIRSRLWPGQLVSITFDDEILEDVEFSTTGYRRTHHVFFENIRLDSWPSWNDYFGEEIRVQEGDIATVMKKMGRPLQICIKPEWAIYDIYEVLINGKVCQTFRCHLVPLAYSSSGGVR